MRINKHQAVLAVGIVLAVATAVVAGLLSSRDTTTATTNTSTDARAKYAALYQAAWRQDSGQGNVLVTATLMVPPMVTTLAADTGRSSAEEQLNQALSGLSNRQIGVLLTIDSITGAIVDDRVEHGAALIADGQTFTTADWQPFIAPSHVVNASTTTSSQSGLLVFQADQAVDWAALKNLKLSMSGIDDQLVRAFTWAVPELLLNI